MIYVTSVHYSNYKGDYPLDTSKNERGGGGFFGGGNPHCPEDQDIKDLAVVAQPKRATTTSILKSVKLCLVF